MRGAARAIGWEFQRHHRVGLVTLAIYFVAFWTIKSWVLGRATPIRFNPPDHLGGLIIAPLYAQFRPSYAGGTRPIDLLALRRDGRLVVIELKVAEDATLALQGADYWRRVEAHRRRGHLSQSSTFT